MQLPASVIARQEFNDVCSWRIKVREMVQVRSGLDPHFLTRQSTVAFPILNVSIEAFLNT